MTRKFWNTCPQKHAAFPEAQCPLGKASSQTKEAKTSCDWFINSAKDNFCFWKWVRNRSDEEGTMDDLQLREMSKLLKIPLDELTTTFDEAIEILKKSTDFQELKEFFRKKV